MKSSCPVSSMSLMGECQVHYVNGMLLGKNGQMLEKWCEMLLVPLVQGFFVCVLRQAAKESSGARYCEHGIVENGIGGLPSSLFPSAAYC